MNRRDFIVETAQTGTALSILGLTAACSPKEKELFFKISLAQWSLYRTLRKKEINHLDFAASARKLGCEGIEYINAFFFEKAKDISYLNEMKSRANSEGVENVLIMIDVEGALTHNNTTIRLEAKENHYK